MNPVLRRKESGNSHHPAGLSSLCSPRVLVQSAKSVIGKKESVCKDPQSNARKSVDVDSVAKGITCKSKK
jgi:hypothetical protein